MNKFNLFFLASLYFVTIYSFPLHTISSDRAKMLINPSTITESIELENESIDSNDDNIDSNNYSEKDLDYFGPGTFAGGSTPPPSTTYKGATLNKATPDIYLICPDEAPEYCQNAIYKILNRKDASRCIKDGCHLSAPLIKP